MRLKKKKIDDNIDKYEEVLGTQLMFLAIIFFVLSVGVLIIAFEVK